MSLYILDTDHLSLYGRNNPILLKHLKTNSVVLTTTTVNIEEQLRGRLAQVSDAKMGQPLFDAYHWLSETMMMLSSFKILQFTIEAQSIYQGFKQQRIRVGTQDLRIAAITCAHGGTLLSRNLKDFEKVPELIVQDWTIER
jgi:tRNA(fMet)-specific endonuclease VapC